MSVPSIVVLTLFKLLLAVVMSLAINNWWSFSHGSGNNHLIDSCSNPTPGNCHSYCDDIVIIDVDITTDDFTFVTGDTLTVKNTTVHEIEDPYCIAEFRSNCAYRYWLVFKLVPITFHIAGFLMQLVTWWYYKDFTPQEKQYDVLIAHLYPEVSASADSAQEGATVVRVDYRDMFRGLLERPYASAFGLLEVLTVVYVWGELLYPPVYCGSARPLSLYYYPLAMTLLELTKFNFYVSTVLSERKRYDRALFALLNIEMMGTTAWVTTLLAIIFLLGSVYDCCLRLKWLLQLAAYKLCGQGTSALGMPEWPAMPMDPRDGDKAAVTTATDVTSIQMNPMVGCVNDVENSKM